MAPTSRPSHVQRERAHTIRDGGPTSDDLGHARRTIGEPEKGDR
jgi:hypothetical protein